jgi:ATP-dependent DNA helicase RecG
MIAKALGQKGGSGQLNQVVRDLLRAGSIERTLPDKPTSRLQQYRLVRTETQDLA